MSSQPRRSPRAPHQLRAGRHGLSRKFVARNQRDRILIAVAEATSERGYAAASVEDVIVRAGVSRRTFYDLFKNKEDAFLAAFDEAVRRMLNTVRRDLSDGDDLATRITSGLRAFLELLVAAPPFATMCIVEVLAAGPEAVRRRNDAIAAFAAMIDDEAKRAGAPVQSPIAAELLVSGIYGTVYNRLAAGRTDELPGLLPEFVSAALVPYLGEEAASAARRELLGDARVPPTAA